MSKVTKELLKEMVPKKYKGIISEGSISEINKLIDDPDYGEEFRESMLTHLDILSGKEPWTLNQYMDAIKYYSLTAVGLTQVDAYTEVFPERLQSRLDSGQTRNDMSGEASRFNKTDLVNRIRERALVPLHLVNQGTLQLAINKATELMINAKSEKVQGDMALGLIKELRPPEMQKVELQIGLNEEAQAARDRSDQKLVEIAQNQRLLLESGMKIEDIQKIHMQKDSIDADISDE